MQQLQRIPLQQLQARQRQHVVKHSTTLVCRHVHRGRRPQLQQPQTLEHAILPKGFRAQRYPRTTCNSAPGDGTASSGDVIRPSAKAAAPPASSVDVTGQTSTSTGSHSASSSGFTSYSDMYKALNNSSYSKAADSSTPKSKQSTSNTSAHQHGPTSGSTGTRTDGLDISSNGHQLSGKGSVDAPGEPRSSTAAVDPAGVDEAIRKAQEALAAAESSLTSIHQLRSAQPPNKWTGLLQLVRSAAIVVASGALLVASHANGLGWQWAGATLGALGLAGRAYQRETVTPAGAAVVAVASLATLGCSLRFGLVMLAYSYTSHKLRQFKESRMPADYKPIAKPAQPQARNWPELLCIVFIPTVLAIAYGAMAGCLDTPLGSLPTVETWRADLMTLLQGAVLGWYACCCGDAWATELGSLSSDQPRLVTTLQPVRRGTHGAITLMGLSGAAAGGLLMGTLFYCAVLLSPTFWVFDVQRQAAMTQWRLIPLGLIAGVFGSLLDSLFGAALQFTGYNSDTATLSSVPGPGVSRISGLLSHKWMTDNIVNVLAGSLTAVLTAVAALRMFG